MASVMKSFLACAVLTTGLMAVVSGQAFDCDNYNPLICTADAIMFCLTNGTIITGRCHAQRAVCVEKKSLDSTFAACSHGSGNRFNCDQYNPLVCTKDLIPFCLRNGTVVKGTCAAKQAVCKENQQVDEHFTACNKAGSGPDVRNPQTGDNSAATVSAATISLLLGLLLSALF